MKPQPPVTRIRTARASSAEAGALGDFPLLGDYIDTWKNALAESEWTPWLIIGLAAFLRFLLLGMKPPHFDEGINGWFVDQMLRNGFYKYDPTNYHGPLHFYVLFLSQTLFGRNLWALRLPVVLVSISCVWLTLKFEPFIGRTVSRLAALAMAVSPGFVFLWTIWSLEIWQRELSLVRRHGIGRNDFVEGDLHPSRRLRGDRGGRLLHFKLFRRARRRPAGHANLELSRSRRCHRDRHCADCFLLFGHLLSLG